MRGRASTGGAVAASLLCAPILGPAMILSQPGELACPQCGQSFGRAPVFSNYQRAPEPAAPKPEGMSRGFKVFMLLVALLVAGTCLIAMTAAPRPATSVPYEVVPSTTSTPPAAPMPEPRRHRHRSGDTHR